MVSPYRSGKWTARLTLHLNFCTALASWLWLQHISSCLYLLCPFHFLIVLQFYLFLPEALSVCCFYSFGSGFLSDICSSLTLCHIIWRSSFSLFLIVCCSSSALGCLLFSTLPQPVLLGESCLLWVVFFNKLLLNLGKCKTFENTRDSCYMNMHYE